jgi:hypothetical protein
VTYFGGENYFAMLRQAAEQLLQASAQRWQWSILCLAHSAAHASHAAAHTAHIAFICSPPCAINDAVKLQISAHSISSDTHLAMDLESSLLRQAVAH